MYSNQDSIEMFNQMVAMGPYYASGRPINVDPAIIIEDICSKIQPDASDILLDVGCGTGVVTLPLSRRCGHIHAIDAGREIIKEARMRCHDQSITNITYHLGGALDLPFEPNAFDHVLMYAVIHYLENEEQVQHCVQELLRVCKPGGRVLIAEIPDQKARRLFEAREKTPQEIGILNHFKANRVEYDQLFKKFVRQTPEDSTLVLDCEKIVAFGKQVGCEGYVCVQDIRQPFSLTRRDVLLTKKQF